MQKLRKIKHRPQRPHRLTVALTIVAVSVAAGTVVFNSDTAKAHYNHIYIAQAEATTPSGGTTLKGAGQPAVSSTSKDDKGTPESLQAQDKEISRNDAKPQKNVGDLPNFHEVHPYLYRSGEPSPTGIKKLHEMGVKTLIDLRAPSERAHDEKKLAEELGMRYINLPMTAKPPTEAQVKILLKTIDKAKEKNEPVLVHCAHGSDRTGCMIGIYRVTRDDWGFDDTYKEMRKYFFGVKYNMLRDAVKHRATH